MSDGLIVASHRGPYEVTFHRDVAAIVSAVVESTVPTHCFIDRNVAELYSDVLRPLLNKPSTLVIDATESAKSLAELVPVFEHCVTHRVRRADRLVAIGGGIVQDICCFVASTLLRGVPWEFVPTTLLAQADSCIGSKSSINLGTTKNIVGTFHPPMRVLVCPAFLDTLQARDVCSGIGEILKVHVIDGAAAFDQLAADYDALLRDRDVLAKYVRAALEIKRRYIELDEFDVGPRNVFNYGHSFGHAIESATSFAVPHGIAVTVGMDMANTIATARGLISADHRDRMHDVLRRNYLDVLPLAVSVDDLLGGLIRDKKNTANSLRLILPVGPEAAVQPVNVPPDAEFRDQCGRFLESINR